MTAIEVGGGGARFVGMLTAATASWYFADSMARPLLAVHFALAGLTGAELAFVLAAFNLSPLLLALPVAKLCQRTSPRVVLATASLLGAATLPFYALTSSLTWLLALQLLGGTAAIGVIVSGQIIASMMPTLGARASAVANYSLAVSLGAAVGPAAGGLVAGAAGIGVLLAAAAVVQLVAMAFAMLLPDGDEGSGDEELPLRSFGTLRRLVRQPHFQAGLLTSFALTAALTLRSTYLPVYLGELALPYPTIGGLIAASSTAAVGIRLFAARILRTYPLAATATAALMLGSVGIGLVSASPALPAIAVASIVWGAGVGFNQPVGMYLVSFGGRRRETMVAVSGRILATRVAAIGLPIAFGAASVLVGYRGAFLLTAAVIGLVGAAVWFVLGAAGREGSND